MRDDVCKVISFILDSWSLWSIRTSISMYFSFITSPWVNTRTDRENTCNWYTNTFWLRSNTSHPFLIHIFITCTPSIYTPNTRFTPWTLQVEASSHLTWFFFIFILTTALRLAFWIFFFKFRELIIRILKKKEKKIKGDEAVCVISRGPCLSVVLIVWLCNFKELPLWLWYKVKYSNVMFSRLEYSLPEDWSGLERTHRKLFFVKSGEKWKDWKEEERKTK